MSGPEFDIATQGARDGGAYTRPTLASPRLKYYMRRSCLLTGPDERMFFLALTPPEPDEAFDFDVAHAVGMLELQVSPYDEAQVWLKYLTVHEAFQRQGIAKALLDLMVQHVRANPRRIARSRASDEGAMKIQGYIDRLLDAQGIHWTQSGRA